MMEVDNTPRGRGVCQIDEEGFSIAQFDTPAEAAQALGCSARGVRRVCNGERKTTLGMRFVWGDDHHDDGGGAEEQLAEEVATKEATKTAPSQGNIFTSMNGVDADILIEITQPNLHIAV